MSTKWCAPDRENNRLTCYSLDQLKNIAREYNKTCPTSRRIKINNQNKIQLWNNIRKALNDRCNNEICWIDQDFISDRKALKESFRPKMPKVWKEENYTTWLNTDDINHVMRQYEKKYPDFLFIGTIPLDCGINSDLSCSLTNFNVNRAYKNGIRTIGIVVNTDMSTGPGIHWYSVVIDLKRNRIIHFDSYGENALNETMAMIRRVQKDFKNGQGKDLKIEINDKIFQTDSHNCGAYSMFFIIKVLEGKTLSQIKRMNLSSEKMQKLKKEWYRN